MPNEIEEEEQAQQSVARAKDAGSSLQEITASVVTINEMNAQIAQSSKEQATMTEDVNRSVTIINELTEHIDELKTIINVFGENKI